MRIGCRESVQCDDSDSAFEPDAVTVDRAGSEQSRTDRGENAVPTDRIREPQHGQEQPRANGDTVEDERLQKAEHPPSDRDSDREQRHAALDRPRRKITSTRTLDTKTLFVNYNIYLFLSLYCAPHRLTHPCTLTANGGEM